MINQNARIFVAGHRGMVGAAVVRALEAAGYRNLITRDRSSLDLVSQAQVLEFLAQETPDYVIVAAARVGGIHANNTYPANFLYDNLMIESNLIHGAHMAGCEALLFLGSSCIYPRLAEQPMAEDALLSGHLESTNEAYAIAKIAGIKLCESYNRQFGHDYRSLMPTNLYGPGDNFHAEDSHVIPALMRRFHEAKLAGTPEVQVWGTGRAKREFLHVDDLAQACLHLMNLSAETYRANTCPMQSHLNAGTGTDVSIKELAETLVDVVGYRGRLTFDTSRPDGTPRKLLDVSRMKATGWEAQTPLGKGLAQTYQWFCENYVSIRT